MGCEVYANNDEIACKAGDGKVIAAFPDVCLTPPSPPAGPIPVPYPDTSFSKDMQNGSKTVKIKGKEVMLKDKSYYKTSPLGDEAATRGLGAGIITHVITGKTYFIAWSMDVKFEGKNVDRHTDLTTSNHASPTANAVPPMLNAAGQVIPNPPQEDKCECCDATPRHEGQRGGLVVSEDEFYGLDEVIPPDPPEPAPHPHRGTRRDQQAAHRKTKATLATRREKLAKRKETVEKARKSGCPAIPAPPCNVYRVFPQTQEDTDNGKVTSVEKGKQIDAEWALARDNYQAAHGITKDMSPAEKKVHHRTPKQAGGCPTGENNLVPNKDISQECQQMDTDLTNEVQTDVANRWQAGWQ